MVRFLLEKFRTVPGPLKQARVVAADLAEELLDLARHQLERRGGTGDGFQPRNPEPFSTGTVNEPPQPPPPPADVEAVPGAGPAKPRKKKAGKSSATDLDLPEELAAAVDLPTNLRKQDFKILAILWDSGNRKQGPLSAKGISQHGVRMGIPIRHENVRKVIRSRLEKHVAIHTEVVGNGTVYRYEINPDGKLHFERTFLRPGA